MKNTLLKYSSLLLLAASLVFTSCKDDEGGTTTNPPATFTVADGKVGAKLSTGEWFADSLVDASYNPTSRVLDLEAVKYNPGTKVLASHFIVSITLDRTTPNKKYTANFNPNSASGDLIFFGTAADEREFAINPGEYSSVGEFTVSNFSATSKRATVDIKNLVWTRNGKSTTIVEGKFNNVKLK
jgi:hypothetical protein